jgi:plasmid stabilization system protein ParE
VNHLRFHSGARAEFRESALFYEGELSGLGAEFVAEVERTIEFVVAHPNAGSPLWGDFRRSLVRRFPFAVIYRAKDETVYVVAVAHQRRRPNYWRSRG